MLDESEYAVILDLYRHGMQATKEFRVEHGLPIDNCSIEERFRPLLAAYQRLTGFEETVPAAVMHHRILLYGPPCAHCGKPLRSPGARICAACGQQVVS